MPSGSDQGTGGRLLVTVEIVNAAVGVVSLWRAAMGGWSGLTGWPGVAVAITLFNVLAARRTRHRASAITAVACATACGVVATLTQLASRVPFDTALGRWALVMTPVTICSFVFGSSRVREFLAHRGSVARALVVVLASPVVLIAVVVVVLVVNATARTVGSAFDAPHPPRTTAEAVVASQQGERPRRFPDADSECVGTLKHPTPAPHGVDEVLWLSVLLEAEQHDSWGLCRVGSPQHGDGILDVKVFSRAAGPEGHILARRRGDGTVETAFVEPQAGQLYYGQPGGDPLVSWGMPDRRSVPCGEGGRLVIFRRADGTISGVARWSRSIGPTTRGAMAAYFTPDALLVPLLTVLEADDRTFPVAQGVVVGSGPTASQNFYKELHITASQPAHGELTERRLLARCG